MKVLKALLILSVFSILFISCSDKEIVEKRSNNIEDIQATGDDYETVDLTKKD